MLNEEMTRTITAWNQDKILSPFLFSELSIWRDEVAPLEAELAAWIEKGVLFVEQGEQLRALQVERDALPGIKISDGDVWFIFPNAMISIEGICRFGAPGPIVKKNLRAWRDKFILETTADHNA